MVFGQTRPLERPFFVTNGEGSQQLCEWTGLPISLQLPRFSAAISYRRSLMVSLMAHPTMRGQHFDGVNKENIALKI